MVKRKQVNLYRGLVGGALALIELAIVNFIQAASCFIVLWLEDGDCDSNLRTWL